MDTYCICYRGLDFDCAAAKVTEFQILIGTEQDILRFDVSMSDWWLLSMHVDKAFQYMLSYLKYLIFLHA